MGVFRTFWSSPVGPKTTHFWGPIFNWGIPIAALMDAKKSPELVSTKMTGVMCVYSALFMRFAWMVKPRNIHLLVFHASNETVQLYQLSRLVKGSTKSKDDNSDEAMGSLSDDILHKAEN